MNIIRPTLLVDEVKCRQHIHTMAEKAKRAGVIFRPHFKTHQSRAIAKWFSDEGVSKITTSSIAMATYFADAGWKDITVAFPLNYLEVETINALASKIVLNLCTSSVDSIQMLSENLRNPMSIFIEIDTGYGRTGINSEDYNSIDIVIASIEKSELLTFAGFLSHAGHSYKCRTTAGIEEVNRVSNQKASVTTEHYRKKYPSIVCSVGDTPSCSVATNLDGVDEIRPGNFIFYDVTQTEIRSCSIDDVSVVVACPVVAIHESKYELIVHGGAVHLSKDSVVLKNGKQIFGRLATLSGTGWHVLSESFFVKSISQEHGTLAVPQHAIKDFGVGDVVGIIPVHSCLAADCMGGYTTLTGERLDHMKRFI